MFCESCGNKMGANSVFCSSCGAKAVDAPRSVAAPSYVRPKSPPEISERESSGSAGTSSSLALFFVDPIGSIRPAFEELGPQKALLTGLLFAVISEFFIVFGSLRLADSLINLIGGYFGMGAGDSAGIGAGNSAGIGGEASAAISQIDLTKPVLVGFLPFITLSIALFLARLIFKEKGATLKDAFAGDLFVAGAATLPLGFFVLVSSFLGVGNIELIAALFLFAICYTILILFAGLTRIAKIADLGAAFAVPTVILSSAYILKVVVTSLYDAGALN